MITIMNTYSMSGPRSGVLCQHLAVVVTIVNTSKPYATGPAKFNYVSEHKNLPIFSVFAVS